MQREERVPLGRRKKFEGYFTYFTFLSSKKTITDKVFAEIFATIQTVS